MTFRDSMTYRDVAATHLSLSHWIPFNRTSFAGQASVDIGEEKNGCPIHVNIETLENDKEFCFLFYADIYKITVCKT